jgi:hypothetical protein
MKRWLTVAVLFVSSEYAAAQQPPPPPMKPEDRPYFVSLGAVTMFELHCLNTYPNREKFNAWQQEHASDKLDVNDYKHDPSDEVYRIPTPAVSFVLVAEKGNACTIYAMGTKRKHMEEELEKVLRAYAEAGKGWTLKISGAPGAPGYSKQYQVLSPAGVPYIDVIYSDAPDEVGTQSSAMTAATRRRNANSPTPQGK